MVTVAGAVLQDVPDLLPVPVTVYARVADQLRP
jgi:hypothetical protein